MTATGPTLSRRSVLKAGLLALPILGGGRILAAALASPAGDLAARVDTDARHLSSAEQYFLMGSLLDDGTAEQTEEAAVAYRRALQQLARREGWSFRFYDERALTRLGAGAFLAVSRANGHRGAGIARLTYRPRGVRRARRVGLVGKGICFDTGGINLKTPKGMYLMHGDMQGSAVAVGTLLALTRARAPLEVDCWLALTENEIGPRAYRPQEVVRAMNGVTIQVVHSDAEGRMVLADTLALASRTKPALTWAASAGQMCCSSQGIRGRSSAKPRSRLMAAWPWAFTRPGSSTCPGNSSTRRALMAAASLRGNRALMRSPVIARLWFSSTVPRGSTGTIQPG